MQRRIIGKSKYYILLFLLLTLISLIIKYYFKDYILNIDLRVNGFVNTFTKDSLTSFFKIITYLGSEEFYALFLTLLFILSKNKKGVIYIIINILVTLLMSNILKLIIRRDRPLINLIERPSSYSFPSGHSMCAVAFYGMLLYILNKKVNNKFLKIILNILLSMIVFLIMFSRVYLSVHYLSDVILGSVFGVLVLNIIISYDKINNIV